MPNDHHTTGITAAVSNLTITNPGAVQVVGAAPIYTRATTLTETQPQTAVRSTFLRTTTGSRPRWFDIDPEVYNSDGE
jgi:hypothetical protein